MRGWVYIAENSQRFLKEMFIKENVKNCYFWGEEGSIWIIY